MCNNKSAAPLSKTRGKGYSTLKHSKPCHCQAVHMEPPAIMEVSEGARVILYRHGGSQIALVKINMTATVHGHFSNATFITVLNNTGQSVMEQKPPNSLISRARIGNDTRWQLLPMMPAAYRLCFATVVHPNMNFSKKFTGHDASKRGYVGAQPLSHI